MITSFAMWMMLRRMNGWWGNGAYRNRSRRRRPRPRFGRARLPNGPTVRTKRSATPAQIALFGSLAPQILEDEDDDEHEYDLNHPTLQTEIPLRVMEADSCHQIG